MEVLPTAAFPHKTNLTALLDEFGFDSIFPRVGSVVVFSFLHESHINLITNRLFNKLFNYYRFYLTKEDSWAANRTKLHLL